MAQLNGITDDRPARTGLSFYPNLIGPNRGVMVRIHITSKPKGGWRVPDVAVALLDFSEFGLGTKLISKFPTEKR